MFTDKTQELAIQGLVDQKCCVQDFRLKVIISKNFLASRFKGGTWTLYFPCETPSRNTYKRSCASIYLLLHLFFVVKYNAFPNTSKTM